MSITRLDYSDHPFNFALSRWAAFTIVPLWSYRGEPDNGSFANRSGSI